MYIYIYIYAYIYIYIYIYGKVRTSSWANPADFLLTVFSTLKTLSTFCGTQVQLSKFCTGISQHCVC